MLHQHGAIARRSVVHARPHVLECVYALRPLFWNDKRTRRGADKASWALPPRLKLTLIPQTLQTKTKSKDRCLNDGLPDPVNYRAHIQEHIRHIYASVHKSIGYLSPQVAQVVNSLRTRAAAHVDRQASTSQDLYV